MSKKNKGKKIKMKCCFCGNPVKPDKECTHCGAPAESVHKEYQDMSMREFRNYEPIFVNGKCRACGKWGKAEEKCIHCGASVGYDYYE